MTADQRSHAQRAFWDAVAKAEAAADQGDVEEMDERLMALDDLLSDIRSDIENRLPAPDADLWADWHIKQRRECNG